jgi:hypothetical protein
MLKIMNLTVMEMGKKRLKQRAANFYCMRFSLLVSVNAMEFQTAETYTNNNNNNNNNNMNCSMPN